MIVPATGTTPPSLRERRRAYYADIDAQIAANQARIAAGDPPPSNAGFEAVLWAVFLVVALGLVVAFVYAIQVVALICLALFVLRVAFWALVH